MPDRPEDLAIFTSPFTDATPLEGARQLRAQRMVSEFLRRFGTTVGEPLATQLECLPRYACAHPAHSDRALTSLAAAITSTNGDPFAASARALLQLLTAGVHLDVANIVFERPARLGWHGHLLAKARHVRYAGFDRVELELANGERQVFLRTEIAENPRAVALPQVDTFCVVAPWAVDAYASVHVPFALSPLPIDGIMAPLREAWELLAVTSPETFGWCRRVTTDVIALAGSEGTSRSGSNRNSPGQLALSVPASPLTLAELFVHECSHQYFHLATELGPVEDGSDGRLYWSPLTRSERPIDRILLAHHAVANIIRWYRLVVERGLDLNGHAAYELHRQTESLRALESALDQTRALTDRGRALYTPGAQLDVRIPAAAYGTKEN